MIKELYDVFCRWSVATNHPDVQLRVSPDGSCCVVEKGDIIYSCMSIEALKLKLQNDLGRSV